MYYDLLHSPDAVVADVDRTARTLVERVGLLEPRAAWFQPSLCHGYQALFARVHPSRAVSPSRLEVISSGPRSPSPAPTDIPAYIDEIAAMQGGRPCKTHATVLTSSAFSDLVEDLRRRGVVHRVDPPSRDLGHERLWIGFAPDGGPLHSADDDAGLFFEVIPTQCLELPAEVADGMVPDGLELAPGQMVRMAARSYLVEDLDPVLATLEGRLSWPAEHVEGKNGKRRAVMAVNFQRSARFELVEPGVDRDAAEHFARWGRGTYSTRITVRDLDAKAEDLRARGTPFEIRSIGGGVECLRVGVDVVPGFLFEFVDDETDAWDAIEPKVEQERCNDDRESAASGYKFGNSGTEFHSLAALIRDATRSGTWPTGAVRDASWATLVDHRCPT